MIESRVSGRYAKSLLDLAQERGSLAQTAQDMRLFGDTLAANRDLRVMLRSPVVKSDKKMSILRAIFQGKVSDLTMAFFEIITRKTREAELESVASAFQTQYRIMQGIEQATVTTAVPLDAALRERLLTLARQQTGKQIELIEQVDPNLIGGFVLRIGDRQLDDSVATGLQRLRASFVDQSYVSKM